jgi:hypothetical protein
MVDAVTEGTQPAPTDIGVQWAANHFIKGADGATYVPFSVAIDTAALAAPNAALYVRAVSKNATAPAAEQDNRDSSEYAWDNVKFVEVAPNGRVSRAMLLAPGDYEVFVAVSDRSPLQPARNQPPAKAGLVRHDLTVPEFSGDDLAISSVFIGDIQEVATALTPEEQEDNPYTLGSMRIVPSTDFRLKQSSELQVLFWIYGAQQAGGKPDVQVEYSFYRKTAEGEEYFNKTAPQVLNASTLPPQFDLTAGHQLPGSIVIPLASFQAAEFRLEIKLTDRVSGKTLTHNATFTVEA